MMTHDLQVSIIAAPLAAIDPRALSQAWYSALHLAHANVRHLNSPAKPPSPSRVTLHPRPSHETSRHRSASAAQRSVRDYRDSSDLRGAAVDARESRGRRKATPLARAIRNAFFSARSDVKRATFSVGSEGRRVHVVLQTKGNRLTLVVFCPPQMQDTVVRELSRARLSLRARGVACF
jgi:hypothetical protein